MSSLLGSALANQSEIVEYNPSVIETPSGEIEIIEEFRGGRKGRSRGGGRRAGRSRGGRRGGRSRMGRMTRNEIECAIYVWQRSIK